MGFKLFLEAVTWTSPFILLLGVFLVLRFYASLQREYRLLVIYLFAALFTDLASRLMADLWNNNLVLLPLFGFVELALFSIFYYRYMLRSKSVLLLFVLLSGLVLIAVETCYAVKASPVMFHAYARVIDAFLIVLLSILFFKKMGEEEQIPTEMLQLNTVILLFFSVNLLFFLPVNFLINEQSPLKFWFWLANLVFTVGFYAFIIRTIWKSGKTRRQLHFGS